MWMSVTGTCASHSTYALFVQDGHAPSCGPVTEFPWRIKLRWTACCCWITFNSVLEIITQGLKSSGQIISLQSTNRYWFPTWGVTGGACQGHQTDRTRRDLTETWARKSSRGKFNPVAWPWMAPSWGFGGWLVRIRLSIAPPCAYITLM